MKFKIMNMNVMFFNKFYYKRFLNLYNFLKNVVVYKKKEEIFKMCYNIINSYNYFFYIKDIINNRIFCLYVVVVFLFMLIY